MRILTSLKERSPAKFLHEIFAGMADDATLILPATVPEAKVRSRWQIGIAKAKKLSQSKKRRLSSRPQTRLARGSATQIELLAGDASGRRRSKRASEIAPLARLSQHSQNPPRRRQHKVGSGRSRSKWRVLAYRILSGRSVQTLGNCILALLQPTLPTPRMLVVGYVMWRRAML
jgi:hypothetical protein